jgi:hypothetical protein
MDAVRSKFDQLVLKREHDQTGTKRVNGSALPADYVPESERLRRQQESAQ